MTELAKRDWIRRTERRFWPQFVFHYTDINNAVRILEDGRLLSREQVVRAGTRLVSNGSCSVLADTSGEVQDCVRFYFRPRTPTQFYAEGIYSKAELANSKYPDAHCPVPVFLLFDSTDVLTRHDCRFSAGGLGPSNTATYSTARELSELPWHKIYHTGSYDRHSPESSDIAFRRNAEIIVPREIDLSSCRYIYCRSRAEFETLYHLLSPQLRKMYASRIVATTRSDLYERRQTFIQEVRLSPTQVAIQFSPETRSPGPFVLLVRIIDEFAHRSYTRKIEDFMLHKYRLQLALPRRSTSYRIRVYIDSHLAYANAYEHTDLPF